MLCCPHPEPQLSCTALLGSKLNKKSCTFFFDAFLGTSINCIDVHIWNASPLSFAGKDNSVAVAVECRTTSFGAVINNDLQHKKARLKIMKKSNKEYGSCHPCPGCVVLVAHVVLVSLVLITISQIFVFCHFLSSFFSLCLRTQAHSTLQVILAG